MQGVSKSQHYTCTQAYIATCFTFLQHKRSIDASPSVSKFTRSNCIVQSLCWVLGNRATARQKDRAKHKTAISKVIFASLFKVRQSFLHVLWYTITVLRPQHHSCVVT
eukprot:m.18362 g.18362  ORF g.18362 m.18362 type:complete len:108 (+) comp7809_c0_seq2:822-1145(+)